MLPFSRAQFAAVFADYNLGVWPAQIVAYALGLAIMIALWQESDSARRVVGGGLALMWVWTGIAYHGFYFSTINPAAFVFAALFVAQGLLLARAALGRWDLRFAAAPGWRGALGWALIGYAAVIYPLIGAFVGDGWPALPMFGITPCPLTLFTFGVLLLVPGRLPRGLLAIPIVWSLIGGSAAFLLGVPQDWPLLLSGLIMIPMLRHRPQRSAAPCAAITSR